MTTIEYLLVLNFVMLLVVCFLLVRKDKTFKYLAGRLIGHRRVEEDKVSQMIHSEPFALNSYIVLNSDSKIIGINSRAIKMFGWREEELKGHGMDKLITPECIDKYEEYKINHLQKEYETIVEVEAVTKGKDILHIDVLIGKWTDDLDWYYTVIIRDISHRVRNQEALRKAQEHINYLREIYHEGEKIGNVAFWKMDMLTGGLMPSSNFNNLFGVKGMDIPTETLIKRVDVEDKVRVADSIRIAKENKTGYDITYKIHGIDGYISTIRSITSVLKDGLGEVTHIIGMAQLLKKEKPSWQQS